MRYADSHCEVVEAYRPEHTYTFVGPCLAMGKQMSITVKAEDLNKYRRGALIQEAFPYLAAADREFLMTGMSAEGWLHAFGSPDDDEDEEDDS
jgi:hypothetical protein